MHVLEYIHGDIKSVCVSPGVIPSSAEAFYSLTFLLTAITVPASRTLDPPLSSRYQSPNQGCSPPLLKARPSRYGGLLPSSFSRRNSD